MEGTRVDDVIFNRGNCRSARSQAAPYTAAQLELWKKMDLKPSPKKASDYGVDRTYKFGDIAVIRKDEDCTVIEATFITNYGEWTYTW